MPEDAGSGECQAIDVLGPRNLHAGARASERMLLRDNGLGIVADAIDDQGLEELGISSF